MPTPTERSLDNIKIHKVSDLNTWEQNYKTVENPNGLIEPGDLVSFPPNLLGEVLPDYPTTAGTTYLKATTTNSGTTMSWDTIDSFPAGGQTGDVLTSDGNNSVEWTGTTTGNLIDLVTSISSDSTDTQIPTAAAVWSARPSVPTASTTNPLMDGTASYGSGTSYAREDHVHPTDTTRQPTGNYATLTASATQNGKVNPNQASAAVSSITTSSYTLSNSDAGKLLLIRNACSITIPSPTYETSDDFIIGTEIEVMNYGTGTVTIGPAQDSTVKINGGTENKTIANQYTSAVLKYIERDDNDVRYWVIQGAIS